MTDTRELRINVIGDNRKLTKTLKDTETKTNAFAKRLEAAAAGGALASRGGAAGGLASSAALLRGGGIALGAGIAARQVQLLTTSASDLNEQLTKSQQVFGDSSASVEKWSKTTAKSMGISRTAALEATGTFGNLFATVKIAPAAAAQMSQALVTLAADLASFNNANPTDVLDALRSGLIGEAEPLRRFGVLLSETRVQQVAMANTGKTNAKALTDQEKALARYQIILKDTVKAQGDFARTSEGLANQQRKLKAQTDDLKVSLGKGLLPVMTEMTKLMTEGVGAAALFGEKLGKVGVTGERIGFVIKDSLVSAIPVIGQAHKATQLWNLAFGQTEQKIFDVTAAAKAFGDAFGVAALQASDAANKAASVPAFGQPGFKPGKAPAVPLGPSVEKRNTIIDQGISRAAFRAQSDDAAKELAGLKEIEAMIVARIAVTNDITRKLKLEDDLITVQRQQQDARDRIQASAEQRLADQKQARLDKRQAAEEKRLKAAQARATRIAQITARQFKQLGLNAEGDQPTPGVANLKKRVATFADAVKGSFLDTSKTKAQLARFRKVLEESLVPKDVRAKMDELLRDLNAKLNANAKKGPLTKTRQLNADRIIDGLGLSRDEARSLKARLSHFNSGGVALAGSGGSSSPIVVHSNLYIDGSKVATSTTKHQQKRRRRNPQQTRGRNGGV
jgi:hypothetical protein